MPRKERVDSLPCKEGSPYSPVVVIGNHYHFSGIIPELNEEWKLISPGDITFQVEQVLEKMKNLLEKCGLSLNDVYSVTVMMSGSLAYFSTMNELYLRAFADVEIKPRRKAFAVVELPFHAMVEIEFDAVKQD